MVSTEEIPEIVVVVAPGPVREECFLGSVPALPAGLVAVDGAGLARSAGAVFCRGAHHIPPLALLHLQAEGRRFNKVLMSLINFRESPLI